MKQLPFNACDYRCERCLETDRCAVFRQFSELGGRIEAGDGPDVLRGLRESFRETEKAIKEKARGLGIDIDEIAGGGTAAEIRNARNEGGEDPLLRRCEAFRQDSGVLLKSIGAAVGGEDREYLDDIAWHHTVVPAKMFRAAGWRTGDEEEIAVDARNSAAVAMKSLTICIMAFDHLAARLPALASGCRRLSADARGIREEIRTRFFPPERGRKG